MRGTFADLQAVLRFRESSDRYGWLEPSKGALGAYQFHEIALEMIGYYKFDGTRAQTSGRPDDWNNGWTGKNGIWSAQDFLNNPAAQDKAHEEWFGYLWNTELKNLGAHQYVGKVIDGLTITASGILCGAHLVGANNVYKYLSGGGGNHITDWHGTPVAEYFKLFNGYQTPFDPGGTPAASPVATAPKLPVAPVVEDVAPTKEDVTPTKEDVTPPKEDVAPVKVEIPAQKAVEPKPASPNPEPAPVVTEAPIAEAPASGAGGSSGRQSKTEKWSKFDKWDSGRLNAFLEGRDFSKKKAGADQEKAAAIAVAQVEESETTSDSVVETPAEMAITATEKDMEVVAGLTESVQETAEEIVKEATSDAAPAVQKLPFKTTIFEAFDNWTDGFVFAPGKFATDLRPPSASDLGLDLTSVKSFAYQEFTTTDTGGFSVNLFGLYMHFDKGEGMSFM